MDTDNVIHWHWYCFSAKTSSCDYSRAHFDEEISFSVIYLYLLCYEDPFPASLEGNTAQRLSSFMNETLWEKLVHAWNACDEYNEYFLGYSFWDYSVERGKYIDQRAVYPLVLPP